MRVYPVYTKSPPICGIVLRRPASSPRARGRMRDTLQFPPVLDMDISDKEFEVLKNVWEIQPENYEELILLKGIGPKKIRALALISDLVFGEPASWEDPVKYSFTHGGKDGFPYPVDKEVYDNSINTMRDAIDQAKLKKDEKMKAIKRLDDFIS